MSYVHVWFAPVHMYSMHVQAMGCLYTRTQVEGLEWHFQHVVSGVIHTCKRKFPAGLQKEILNDKHIHNVLKHQIADVEICITRVRKRKHADWKKYMQTSKAHHFCMADVKVCMTKICKRKHRNKKKHTRTNDKACLLPCPIGYRNQRSDRIRGSCASRDFAQCLPRGGGASKEPQGQTQRYDSPREWYNPWCWGIFVFRSLTSCRYVLKMHEWPPMRLSWCVHAYFPTVHQRPAVQT